MENLGDVSGGGGRGRRGTYEVAAVDEAARGHDGLVGGEGLQGAVRGGAARPGRRPEEDLRLG